MEGTVAIVHVQQIQPQPMRCGARGDKKLRLDNNETTRQHERHKTKRRKKLRRDERDKARTKEKTGRDNAEREREETEKTGERRRDKRDVTRQRGEMMTAGAYLGGTACAAQRSLYDPFPAAPCVSVCKYADSTAVLPTDCLEESLA